MLGLLLLAFIIACRYNRSLADFYSLHIYPVISAVLSLVSSPVGLSVQGWAIVVLIVVGIAIIVFAIIRKTGWKKCLFRELNLLLWVFIWFYLGWCLNYSRSSIFERTQTGTAQFDSTAFVSFVTDFTDALNSSYVEDKTVDNETLAKEIKGFYSRVPAAYGLCKPKAWQHPKHMMPQAYHSATGILGYMGPLFSEFHLNSELLPSQLPFTWAHEYAHLMGVSSEAEANWWAWNACMSSDDPAIRYSALFSMLSYVMSNASRLLSEEDFKAWASTVRPEIRDEQNYQRQYWKEKRNPTLDKIQGRIYDLFLKSNSIPSGTKNYSEVIQMMMNIEYDGSLSYLTN